MIGTLCLRFIYGVPKIGVTSVFVFDVIRPYLFSLLVCILDKVSSGFKDAYPFFSKMDK